MDVDLRGRERRDARQCDRASHRLVSPKTFDMVERLREAGLAVKRLHEAAATTCS